METADYAERKKILITYIKDSEIFNKKQREKYEGKTCRDLSKSLTLFQKYFQDEMKSALSPRYSPFAKA